MTIDLPAYRYQAERYLMKRHQWSREDAEDIAGEAVLRALQGMKSLRAAKYARSWFTRIAINLSLDHKRLDDSPAVPLDLMLHEPAGTAEVERIVINKIIAGQIRAEIEGLPDNYRKIIVNHCCDGLTLPEIAAMSGVPIGTLKSRCSRALAALRQRLGGVT